MIVNYIKNKIEFCANNENETNNIKLEAFRCFLRPPFEIGNGYQNHPINLNNPEHRYIYFRAVYQETEKLKQNYHFKHYALIDRVYEEGKKGLIEENLVEKDIDHAYEAIKNYIPTPADSALEKETLSIIKELIKLLNENRKQLKKDIGKDYDLLSIIPLAKRSLKYWEDKLPLLTIGYQEDKTAFDTTRAISRILELLEKKDYKNDMDEVYELLAIPKKNFSKIKKYFERSKLGKFK